MSDHKSGVHRTAPNARQPLLMSFDERNLQSVFARYDTDRSGFLEGTEMLTFVRELGLSSSTRVRRAFEKVYDQNKDKKLSIEELGKVLNDAQERERTKTDAMRRAFVKLDANRSGTLTGAELRQMAKELGEGEEDEARKHALEHLKVEDDQELSIDEFAKLVERQTQAAHSHERLEELFKRFDVDGSGQIDGRGEVRNFLRNVDLQLDAVARRHLHARFWQATILKRDEFDAALHEVEDELIANLKKEVAAEKRAERDVLHAPPRHAREHLQRRINHFFSSHPALFTGDWRPFVHFDPLQMELAVGFADELFDLFNQARGDAWQRLQQALYEFMRSGRLPDDELQAAQEGMAIFLTHHDAAKRFLKVPSLQEAFPEIQLPSREVKEVTHRARADEEESFVTEESLNFFREDPLYNWHHEWWHRVNVLSGSHNVTRRDRQGELFLYMHQQMLARYDTERLSIGLPKVQAFNSDLSKQELPAYDPYNASGQFAVHRRALGERAVYDARPAKQHVSSQPHLDYLLTLQKRLVAAAESHKFVDADGKEYDYAGEFISFSDIFGTILEASTNIDMSKVPFFDHYYRVGRQAGGYHNIGHVAIGTVGGMRGVMLSTATAIRDPVFYMWHRHVDDLMARAQDASPPLTVAQLQQDGAADVVIRDDDIFVVQNSVLKADGFQEGAEQEWGRVVLGDWDETHEDRYNMLHTEMLRRPMQVGRNDEYDIPYLDHRPFHYYFRLENKSSDEKRVTLRVFMVLADTVEDRRMYLEMDKFAETLQPNEKRIVVRSSRVASVMRKPFVILDPQFSDVMDGRTRDPLAAELHEGEDPNYCECGWPNNLLVPRGSMSGKPFYLAVFLTDNDNDTVQKTSRCGSMSYCGTKNAYPDRREMGYPFARKWEGGIADTIAKLPMAAMRKISIQCANALLN